VACRECIREIGLPEGTVVATPDGVVGRMAKSGKVDPGTVTKSALAGPSLADVGRLIAELPGDASAGSEGSYARVNLT
jgi:hypothetical protein